MSRGALPTGSVTFLFTDVVGSTRLWEEKREFMRAALPRHDALAEAVADRHGGMIVRSRGEGDSLFIVFTSAGQAIGAAVDLQRAILSEPWSEDASLVVRMGLHTGEVDLRDGDYYGSAVNRAARIRALAHGGQILVSDTARALAVEQMPMGVTLLDLGEHRLRDLSQPERIFQLVHHELPADFPPIRSLTTQPNNLPTQLTSFVGREREMGEIKQKLDQSRLLTLTGAGGTGKTRLSLEAAAEVFEKFPDGVWFVELASLSDPRLVAQTVAEALGVREAQDEPILKTLLSWLREKQTLLVLDNCEHILQAAGRFAEAILRGAPGVKILASSREALGIAGETTYRVPSLPAPDLRHLQTPASVTRYASVRLFLDRAAAVRPDFAVTAGNAAALASVCHRLDGIPLALELAAARVRAMPVEQIETRLDSRFRLLTGGSRTALPRQQTLRALIDWSYDLLNEPERLTLCRLSVFHGGWRLDCAESVCAGGEVEECEVLDLLTSLVDKSLVMYGESEGVARYRLLETVRHYAQERLRESGEEAIRVRHRDWFLALLEGALPETSASNQSTWHQRLDEEHDNLRAALEFSLAESGSAAGFRMCISVAGFWASRGFLAEGREWCVRSIDRDRGAAPTEDRARVLNLAGLFAGNQSDYAAARSFYDECLTIFREFANQFRVSITLHNLGLLALEQGDYAAARPYFEESLTVFRDIGDAQCVSATLHNLAVTAEYEGDYAAALACGNEALSTRVKNADLFGAACSLTCLGRVNMHLRDLPTARAQFMESLTKFNEIAARNGVPECLEGLASLAMLERRSRDAVILWGVAGKLREDIGAPMPPRLRERYNQEIAEARLFLGGAEFADALASGRTLTPDQVISHVLADSVAGRPN